MRGMKRRNGNSHRTTAAAAGAVTRESKTPKINGEEEVNEDVKEME